jgi:hypothetical protein
LVSKSDATTETINNPPLTGAFAKYGTSYTGSQVAATATTGSTSSSGAHDHGGATGASYTGIDVFIPAGTLDHYHDIYAADTLHAHDYSFTLDFTGQFSCEFISQFFADVAVPMCDGYVLSFLVTGTTDDAGVDGITATILQVSDLYIDYDDPTHAHSIASGGAHTHTLTLNADGEPVNLVLLPYLKR